MDNLSLYQEMDELEASHWWFRGMRGITQTLLNPVIGARRDLRILDAGCGAGGNLAMLQTWGRVFAFDYARYAVQYTSKRLDGRVAQADIQAIPYPDDYFDLVCSFDVLVVVPDDQRAIRELARITRPDGYVYIRAAAMPALSGSHDVAWNVLRRYTAQTLTERVRAAGLEPIRLTYANSFLLPLIYLIRKLQSTQAGESDVKPTAEPINTLLGAILSLERAWIGAGQRFPAGVSLIMVARKPAHRT
ncbi:MAG: class I SAM-dependent methyltransferase [Anaerolineae bacterium]|jgi:SAM-dependent methyltransferase|nr:class I SAM-dependent methyltransferase [Anaerolineae bacterium]